jgi:hypothetical protein
MQRYLKFTIITTNLSFGGGNKFKVFVLTSVIEDRLAYKTFMVNMNDNSFRIKETQDRPNSQNFLKILP